MTHKEVGELIKIYDNGKVTIPEAIRLAVKKWKVVGFAKWIREVRQANMIEMGEVFQKGAMCALGILDFTINGRAFASQIDHSPLLIKLVKALGLEEHDPYETPASRLAHWNNDKKMTHEKAMEAFLKAADDIEAGFV